MKSLLLSLLIALCGPGAFAQFTGYYLLPSKESGQSNGSLLLEASGRFHFFSDYRYYRGKWLATDANNVALTFDKIEPVDVYVSGGEGSSVELSLSGFGDKRAFLRMGEEQRKPLFQAIFSEKPKCSYDITRSLTVRKEEVAEVTIALNLPFEAIGKEGGLFDLYTYKVPEGCSKVHMVVNEDAGLVQRNFKITRKDKQYSIEGVVLEKQEVDNLPRFLEGQIAYLRKAKIDRFKKDYYVRSDKVEKIEPLISRQSIRVEAGPLFSVDCPDSDVIPIDPPPPPHK